MNAEEPKAATSGKLRWTRERERSFFFYATIVMFILYGLMKWFGEA
ncbi:hypothetical protein [Desulfatiglans anilini]|nr:hypothetical protein [Desulfatiglans anilini]